MENILKLIQSKSTQQDLVDDAIRMIERAGITVNGIERNVVSYQRNDDRFSNPNEINEFVNDKNSLEEKMQNDKNGDVYRNEEDLSEGEKIASELIAKAGTANSTQVIFRYRWIRVRLVKRRVWE